MNTELNWTKNWLLAGSSLSVTLYWLILDWLTDWLSLRVSYITTDGQSANLSWYQDPIWGLWPDFYHCQTIAGFWYGAPSLTRGRVCLLQCTMYNTFYCLRVETPPTWRTRSLYLYPPKIGWPGYTPRHWVIVLLLCPITLTDWLLDLDS
jgi:hypothetical protein